MNLQLMLPRLFLPLKSVRIHATLFAMAAAMAVFGNAVRHTAAAEPPAAAVPATLPAGWTEIDQRLVFLTVELSGVENSLDAVNKAIKVNGYEKSTQQENADHAAKGNELMDRNGGGPVNWQDFYGKTAERFFYHPVDDNTGYINPRPHSARPPQFDYIYRANLENQAKSEDEAAKLGNKIDDLRARRRELEAEQSALWCKIALRAVSSRELQTKPIYRFELSAADHDEAAKQHTAAIGDGAVFVRTIADAIDSAQGAMDTDQPGALEALHQAVIAARSELDSQLRALPVLAVVVTDAGSGIGRFDKAARRLDDSVSNETDAFRLASQADERGEVDSKNRFRGSAQQAVMDFAATMLTADQALEDQAGAWKITADLTRPRSAVVSKGGAENGAAGEVSISAKLDRAKTDYTAAVDEAKKSLLSAIDRRMNAVSDAGDLGAVQALQKIKSNFETGGTIVADAKDPAVLSARRAYVTAITSANTRLTGAYRDAVRGYTRARQIDLAQATQVEFESSGLKVDAPANAAGPASDVTVLASGLPPYLEAGAPYAVEKEGIRPDRRKYLRTTDADFLDHDFTLDVWFVAEEREETSAYIGIGEGLRNGSMWRPTSSVDMQIEGLGHMNGEVTLRKDTENGEEIGRLPDTGNYMARVQKSRNVVTFSVGVDHGGTFRPDMSKRIDDIRKFAPGMNDHNSHLFFGSNAIFRQIRLVISGGASPAAAGGDDGAMPTIARPGSVAVVAPVEAVPAGAPPVAAGVSPAVQVDEHAALQPGLSAELYNDMEFNKLLKTRVDSTIDFKWKAGKHPDDAIATARYSVRWTGVLVVPPEGVSALWVNADDGARLMIDGKQVLEFRNPKNDPVRANAAVTPGRHAVVLEYWNRAAQGHVQFLWTVAGSKGAETVPAGALFHAESAAK